MQVFSIKMKINKNRMYFIQNHKLILMTNSLILLKQQYSNDVFFLFNHIVSIKKKLFSDILLRLQYLFVCVYV